MFASRQPALEVTATIQRIVTGFRPAPEWRMGKLAARRRRCSLPCCAARHRDTSTHG